MPYVVKPSLLPNSITPVQPEQRNLKIKIGKKRGREG
jgi:hypothetical protein